MEELTKVKVPNRVLAIVVVCTSSGVSVLASPILTSGAGFAVSSPDRVATFDSLTIGGIDLSGYTEGLLSITVPDTLYYSGINDNHFGPGSASVGGYHYGNGGNSSYVTIATTDGAGMSGLEFLIGHGNDPTVTTVYGVYETYLDGLLTGSGTFTTSLGAIVGFSDTIAGFDELRIGASGRTYTAFGQSQSIAIDNLSVELLAGGGGTVVPEPATLALLGVGLAGVVVVQQRRRRVQRGSDARP